MATDSRRLKRLKKAQSLIKARDEADLDAMRSALVTLQEEDQYLFAMMENETNARLIDPSLIAKRLERNAREEAILNARIAHQRQLLLQSTRRNEILDDKYKAALSQEERKETAEMLEEYVSSHLHKDSSLG